MAMQLNVTTTVSFRLQYARIAQSGKRGDPDPRVGVQSSPPKL
jgi:hypothetical protein